MEDGTVFDHTQGSQFNKEKQTNSDKEDILALKAEVGRTFQGSAGSEISKVILKIEQTKMVPSRSCGKVKNSAAETVAAAKKFHDCEIESYERNDEKVAIMPSPTADSVFQNCLNLGTKELSGELSEQQQQESDETYSYSPDSVKSITSVDEEKSSNNDVERQAYELYGENELRLTFKPLNSKTSCSPKLKTTDGGDFSEYIDQSKPSSNHLSKALTMDIGDMNFSAEVEVSTTLLTEIKEDNDSPKAISLVSCSDDSFAPIRPFGKKRPNMFEDTDTETEQEQDEAVDENENESDYKIDFKRNRNRKGKRIQLDGEKASALPREPKSRAFVSDFDQMLQKRRKQKCKPHVGRRLDFITKNDDLIDQLIDQMEDAAYEDRCLNEQGLPATKKVAMLKFVASQLIKKDLQPLFLEHNILSTLAEWLSPLPSKCLPCLPIRESILHILEDLPTINSALLKESGIGKALMFLCKHPEETKKNRECCRRLIAQWARPIYNLTCDYRAMSKAERQERDIELSTRYKLQVADKTTSLKERRKPARELEQALRGEEPKRVLRPGEHGWVSRARVPQPSTKDYVRRPQSQPSCQLSNILKPQPNRYEVLAKKHQNAKRVKSVQHSKVGLSIFGSKV